MYYYDSPVGTLFIKENDGKLVELKLSYESKKNIKLSPLMKETFKQLDEYFAKKRTTFDLPIYYEGTRFQKRVWEELRKIPYGKTITYQDVAVKIDNPRACRAVGNANGKNNILIIVPCHRVVGFNSIGGFGTRIDVKVKLLELEGVL